METVHPSLILYRPLPGNLETASSLRIASIKETNWYKHMISLDPTLKSAMAGEEAALAEQLAKEKAAKALVCSRCSGSDSNGNNSVKAEVQCDMCFAPFCLACFAHKHKKAPWDAHTFREIVVTTATATATTTTTTTTTVSKAATIGPPPISNKNSKNNKKKS